MYKQVFRHDKEPRFFNLTVEDTAIQWIKCYSTDLKLRRTHLFTREIYVGLFHQNLVEVEENRVSRYF